MRYAVPVEHLLLFLSTDAIVLIKKIKKWTLGFFQRGICTRLQVSQIGENTLLKLLRVLNRTTECLKSERQASHNVRAGDMEKVVPQDARNIFAGGEKESSDVLIWRPVDRRGYEKIFHYGQANASATAPTCR